MTHTDIQSPLMLEENLTIMSAAQLQSNLKALKGQPTELNASNVNHLDMPALQLMLSASKAWASDNVSFEVTNISDNFQIGLDTLGVTLSDLNSAEAA